VITFTGARPRLRLWLREGGGCRHSESVSAVTSEPQPDELPELDLSLDIMNCVGEVSPANLRMSSVSAGTRGDTHVGSRVTLCSI